MGIQDVIALTIAFGAVVFTVRFVWRTLTSDGGCTSCPTVSGKKDDSSPKLKRTPLVNLETRKRL